MIILDLLTKKWYNIYNNHREESTMIINKIIDTIKEESIDQILASFSISEISEKRKKFIKMYLITKIQYLMDMRAGDLNVE